LDTNSNFNTISFWTSLTYKDDKSQNYTFNSIININTVSSLIISDEWNKLCEQLIIKIREIGEIEEKEKTAKDVEIEARDGKINSLNADKGKLNDVVDSLNIRIKNLRNIINNSNTKLESLQHNLILSNRIISAKNDTITILIATIDSIKTLSTIVSTKEDELSKKKLERILSFSIILILLFSIVWFCS